MTANPSDVTLPRSVSLSAHEVRLVRSLRANVVEAGFGSVDLAHEGKLLATAFLRGVQLLRQAVDVQDDRLLRDACMPGPRVVGLDAAWVQSVCPAWRAHLEALLGDLDALNELYRVQYVGRRVRVQTVCRAAIRLGLQPTVAWAHDVFVKQTWRRS